VQEWKPELILVSCGFDAAIGDPLGGLEVSPLGYGYMAGVLASLDIPLVVMLEGGYFLESVAQGAAFVLRALIEKSPPFTPSEWPAPQPAFLHTLYSSMLHYSTPLDIHIYTAWLEVVNSLRHKNSLPLIKPPSPEDIQYIETRKETYPLKLVGVFPQQKPAAVMEFASQVSKVVDAWKKVERMQCPEKIVCKVVYIGEGRVVVETGEHSMEVTIGGEEVFGRFLQLLLIPLRCLSDNYAISVSSLSTSSLSTTVTIDSAYPVDAVVDVLEKLLMSVTKLRELILF